MFLLLNLSEHNTIHLALFDEGRFFEMKAEDKNRELLTVIDRFLTDQGLAKEDVKGIMVVLGAGGFTSTRIGTVVANTFGYILKIPLLGIALDQVGQVQALIPTLLAQPIGQYISATYSGAPNVTVKK